jgi:hypothetical protein
MFGGFTYKNMFSKSRTKSKNSSKIKGKSKSKTFKTKNSAAGRRANKRKTRY